MNLRFTLAITTYQLVDVAVPDGASPEQMNQIIHDVVNTHSKHGSQKVAISAVEELTDEMANRKPAS